MGVKIIGTGSALPKRKVTNFDLEKIVDTTNDWIVERTGIEERRIISDEETSISISLKASLDAISNANIKKSEIDLIIFASITPDYITPSSASIIQKELEIPNCVSFDISAGCSGFVYALFLANSLMMTHSFKYALIIGCDALSKITDWSDRSTCVLFGDGAGAVVLKSTKENKFLSCSINSYPDASNSLYCENLKFDTPFKKDQNVNLKLKMDGRMVFRFATTSLTNEVSKVIEKANLDVDKINFIIPHQANKRIIDYAAEKLKIPNEKFVLNVNKTGNTSAASIPIALDEINKKGKIKEGDLIILVAFGAGLTSGAILIKW